METTNFEIKQAHSGNSCEEIARAKELFYLGVENGKFYNAENVSIEFSDINSIIKVKYIDIDNYTKIGEEII